VKDVFPVEGYPNGWGQPSRLAEAPIDRETHIEVQRLLNAGAVCVGKSQCEELCYSLMGSNKHYGQPVNSRAPDRLTGGSSSGSASLVAAGAVDMATATDTAGSIRAPASFCGLIGLRPTHGVLSLDKAMPLAPSFDCFGWYAKDAQTYSMVADVLLGPPVPAKLTRLLTFDPFNTLLSGPQERRVFEVGAQKVTQHFQVTKTLTSLGFSFEEASRIFITHQSYEAWQRLGPWVSRVNPDLDDAIKERFRFGSTITHDDFLDVATQRSAIEEALETILGEDGVLLLPTVPSCAPLKTSNASELQAFRLQMIQLLCLSGLARLPQITLPLMSVDNAPFGISLLGPKGSDRELVSLGEQIMTSHSVAS
jgi:amidase